MLVKELADTIDCWFFFFKEFYSTFKCAFNELSGPLAIVIGYSNLIMLKMDLNHVQKKNEESLSLLVSLSFVNFIHINASFLLHSIVSS